MHLSRGCLAAVVAALVLLSLHIEHCSAVQFYLREAEDRCIR
jgi:hypothetical protein